MIICAKRIFKWLMTTLAQTKHHSFITAIYRIVTYMFVLLTTAAEE